MIPSVVHRIWLGSPVPAEFEERWALWADLGYERRTWQEADLDDLGMPPHFGAARTFAERSDIARLEILDAVGGVYVDCDVVPLRRPHAINDERDRIVCFEERPGLVCNGLLMAEAGTLGFIRRFTRLNARRNARTPHRTSGRARSRDGSPGLREDPVHVGHRVHPPERLDLDEDAAVGAVARIRLQDDPHWLVVRAVRRPRRAGLDVHRAVGAAPRQRRAAHIGSRRDRAPDAPAGQTGGEEAGGDEAVGRLQDRRSSRAPTADRSSTRSCSPSESDSTQSTAIS